MREVAVTGGHPEAADLIGSCTKVNGVLIAVISPGNMRLLGRKSAAFHTLWLPTIEIQTHASSRKIGQPLHERCVEAALVCVLRLKEATKRYWARGRDLGAEETFPRVTELKKLAFGLD